MLSGHIRGSLILVAALVLCLWVAGIASATIIGPINYEWYADDVHRAKVEETFIPWQDLQELGGDWYQGPGYNCWEYTVDIDPGLLGDAFTVHANAVTLQTAWNGNNWTNPVTGVPLNDITWTIGQGEPLDGQTGLFRIWANAQRGIITGSLHIVGDGEASGDVSGPVTTPEPGSIVLLLCGAAGVGGLVRRRLR